MPSTLTENKPSYAPNPYAPRLPALIEYIENELKLNLKIRPRIALNGGIILPKDVLTGNSIVATFLRSRSMLAGVVYAQEYLPSGKIHSYKSKPTERHYTSITPDYYVANFDPKNPLSPDQRKELVKEKLFQDAELLSQWDAVEAEIKTYHWEKQARVRMAIWQHLANDAIAVWNAYDMASVVDPSFEKRDVLEHMDVPDRARETLISYYQSLLRINPLNYIDIQKTAVFFQQASNILDEVSEAFKYATGENRKIDWMRNSREADLSYHTIRAAVIFNKEFPRANVVILKLGALDNDAALRAVGFEGEIIDFTHQTKSTELDAMGKREIINLDISKETLLKLQGKEVVIYDDSITSGTQLRKLLDLFLKYNISVVAIRVLCLYDGGEKAIEALKKEYNIDDIEAYIVAPKAPNGSRSNGNRATIYKDATQRWFEENNAEKSDELPLRRNRNRSVDYATV